MTSAGEFGLYENSSAARIVHVRKESATGKEKEKRRRMNCSISWGTTSPAAASGAGLCSCFLTTPYTSDHMSRAACFAPAAPRLSASPCSNGRVKLFNMRPGNGINCGISSFVPSSFRGYTLAKMKTYAGLLVSPSTQSVSFSPFLGPSSTSDAPELGGCVYLLQLMCANKRWFKHSFF